VLAIVATTVGMLFAASPALADTGSTAGTVPTVASTPASPVAGCPGVPSSPLLSSLTDLAFYAPVAGGTFEGPMTGWSLNNAQVVNGNEPWNVVGSTDSNSLAIHGDGSATTPSFCVDNSFPSFRFFARSNGGGGKNQLNVAARWTLATGQSGTTTVTQLDRRDYSSWQATPSLPLGSVLPPGQTVSVRLVFSTGPGPGWNIDDVLLDPYAK
jgi:hypothetical protein